MDRQALIDEVLQGNGEPAHWISRPRMRAAPTVEDNPDLGVTCQPEEAKALLDEVYANRSQMAPITLVFPDFERHQNIAKAIQAIWLETLGTEVALAPMSWSDYLDLLENDAPQIFQADVTARTEWYAQAEDLLVSQDAVVIPLYWYTANALTQPYIHRTYSQLDRIERPEKWVVLEH